MPPRGNMSQNVDGRGGRASGRGSGRGAGRTNGRGNAGGRSDRGGRGGRGGGGRGGGRGGRGTDSALSKKPDLDEGLDECEQLLRRGKPRERGGAAQAPMAMPKLTLFAGEKGYTGGDDDPKEAMECVREDDLSAVPTWCFHFAVLLPGFVRLSAFDVNVASSIVQNFVPLRRDDERMIICLLLALRGRRAETIEISPSPPPPSSCSSIPAACAGCFSPHARL